MAHVFMLYLLLPTKLIVCKTSIWAFFTLCVNRRGSKGHIVSEPGVPLSFTN